jgi:hypothetical protein
MEMDGRMGGGGGGGGATALVVINRTLKERIEAVSYIRWYCVREKIICL